MKRKTVLLYESSYRKDLDKGIQPLKVNTFLMMIASRFIPKTQLINYKKELAIYHKIYHKHILLPGEVYDLRYPKYYLR